MRSNKSVIKLLVINLVFVLGFAGTASANEAESKTINDILCKDVLRASGNERDIAMAFMHGYLLAKSGKDVIDRPKLSKASDDFIEACLNDSNSKAITTLGKQLK